MLFNSYLFFAISAIIVVNLPNARGESERCLRPLDPGPCQFYQRRFYFDQSSHQCMPFNYGGCLGNENRFATERECTNECVYRLKDSKNMPDICLMDPDAGKCPDSTKANGQIWYFFNSETGLCENFLYHGCAAGNQNRFYSLYQCKKICGERFDPQIACENCDIRTSVCTAVSKYAYVCECRNGYLKTEQGECVDMDECDMMRAECHTNARCINTIGSYRCECIENYVGDGVNECKYVGPARKALNCADCDENAHCLSDKCQCKTGFQGDGLNCTDVNECEESEWPCDQNAECINVSGSFYCECLPNYAGNGRRCSTMSCLDRFDSKYKEPCLGGKEWHEHYYLDHATKKCEMFWTDGCVSNSMNIFSQHYTCEKMCVQTNILSRADSCWDKFDPALRNQCSKGEWQQRYFFDHSSMTCQLFWYDGCKTSSRNMFDDLLTCQWLCEEEPRYKTRACLEPFDEHYRDECNGGMWRQNYYFDKHKMRCVAFWFDGCTGKSANLFPDLSSCVQTCEVPVEELGSLTKLGKSMYKQFTDAPRHPHRHHSHNVPHSSRYKMNRPETGIYEGSSKSKNLKTNTTAASKMPNENICEVDNPCQNNSTCVYDKLKKAYYCECVGGYANRHCTELDDRDPCARHPCKNGATCTNKPGKDKLQITFDCFCASGYGGMTCEEKPCDPSPCNNNGTCRTTKGTPSFFCECQADWGGNMCNIQIPNQNTRKYGKNVELLSSGKPEWIEDLRKYKMRERKLTGSGNMEARGNYTESDGGDLASSNGTKTTMKSQTLRLPAGSKDSAAELNCAYTVILSLFLLFISIQLSA